MLSFDKWKKLNENMGASCLGLKQPQTVAKLQSRWDEMGAIPMAKKKMFGDAPMPTKKPLGKPTPDMGDEMSPDMGDDSGNGDEMGDEMGDEHEEGDEDHLDGDEDGDNMGDDGEHQDGEDGDMGGEGSEDGGDMGGEMGDLGGDLGGEDMGAKPPMKKPLMKNKNIPNMAPQMMKKGMKKESAETQEERDFWASLQKQAGATYFVRDETGDFVASEDAVIPPSDPNFNITEPEPTPGNVGYAPSGKVGTLGTFAEWSSKYKR